MGHYKGWARTGGVWALRPGAGRSARGCQGFGFDFLVWFFSEFCFWAIFSFLFYLVIFYLLDFYFSLLLVCFLWDFLFVFWCWSFLAFLLVWLVACGVGLSLHSLWFICVAPMRGSTHFLCGRKESKQRKRLTPPARRCLPRTVSLVVRDEIVSRAAFLSGTALIRSSVALRAPPSGASFACSEGASRHARTRALKNCRISSSFLAKVPDTHWFFARVRDVRGAFSRVQTPPLLPSLANPSATHVVRSGVDERCVIKESCARDDLVSDH
jgi:hypothetical protein